MNEYLAAPLYSIDVLPLLSLDKDSRDVQFRTPRYLTSSSCAQGQLTMNKKYFNIKSYFIYFLQSMKQNGLVHLSITLASTCPCDLIKPGKIVDKFIAFSS